MQKRDLPWYWFVGIALLMSSPVINLVNQYAFESPKEWITIAGSVVSVIAAVILFYSLMVILKKKRTDKSQ